MIFVPPTGLRKLVHLISETSRHPIATYTEALKDNLFFLKYLYISLIAEWVYVRLKHKALNEYITQNERLKIILIFTSNKMLTTVTE